MKLGLFTAIAVAFVCFRALPAAADSWKTVACSETKFSMPSNLDAKCEEGPENNGGTTGRCVFEQYYLEGLHQTFQAQIYMSGTSGCYVNNVKSEDAAIKDFFREESDGTSNWSEFKRVGGATGAYFDRNGLKCFAYYRPGPPRFVGVAYNIYGFYCAPKGQPLDEASLTSFIRSVGVND